LSSKTNVNSVPRPFAVFSRPNYSWEHHIITSIR